MEVDALAAHRQERDEFLRSHYASPLPDEDQEVFAGLSYFAPDSTMAFTGRVAWSNDVRVPIVSSFGTTSEYHQMGIFHVKIGGAAYNLVVLDDGDGNPFIAFGDVTNGRTTYAGGRYVPLDADEDGSGSIDFDVASNPYCVYDEEFVCPLPPLDNRIALSIEAGEMMYVRPPTTDG